MQCFNGGNNSSCVNEGVIKAFASQHSRTTANEPIAEPGGISAGPAAR